MGRVYDLAEMIHFRLLDKRKKEKREKIILAVVAMIMTAAAGASTVLYMDAEGQLNLHGDGVSIAYDPSCHGTVFSKEEKPEKLLKSAFGK